ncbi:MAG: hypothetical protein WCK37_01475 [Candidatus Falkowbacteria bacterium]
MTKNKGKIFLNTVFWGFILWLFGYILGFLFFALVPKNVIGWYIMPFGLAATLWVLLKKIKREEFMCYIGLGVIWTIMAIALDYFFLVKLLKAVDYYKLDVYLYYFLTFALPVAVGMYRFNKTKKASL